MQSKMEIGRAYRMQAMHVLTHMGYATTRQIAMCLFGGCADSDRKQASRTIRWLLERRYVVEKRSGSNASGERMIALTRAGVHAIGRDMGLMGGKVHARDWLRHAHSHRTACNSAWAACHGGLGVPGCSELEIRAGAAPSALSCFRFRSEDGAVQNKVPDLLLNGYCGVSLPGVVWGEIENGWRGARDLRKLVDFLRSLFHPNQPAKVHQVWFVVTAEGGKSIGKRLRNAMTHALDSGYSARVKALDVEILADRIKVFRLDSATLSLSPILF